MPQTEREYGMQKYIVVKRDPKDGRIYTVTLLNDAELELHIIGTFKNTNHIILSVVNTGA